MSRVLFISYTFPPVGGAGVQRIAKFAKYLPGCDWDVSVLTASNPSVPLFDESLSAEIPRTTVIERAPTWEPSYALKSSVAAASTSTRSWKSKLKAVARSAANAVLQPDPQVLWAPQALRHGKRLLRRLPHDVIVASGPPFSAFLIGARLSRWFKLPLVLDYRDEWDISNAHWENRRFLGIGRRYQNWLQTRVLRTAHAVIATTNRSAQQIAARAEQARATPEVRCVYNGFDPDDFVAPSLPRQSSDMFRITYTGTLWKLTSIAPLVAALEHIERTEAELAKRLELVIAGRRTQEQDTILDRLLATSVRLVRHDYLPHDEAVQLMRNSDLLCALLSDTLDAGRVVPAKLFEYMACGRPILSIAPSGEMWELLHEHPQAYVHAPGDITAIAQSLRDAMRAAQSPIALKPQWDAARYSRPTQAQQLANILSTAIASSQTRSIPITSRNLLSVTD